MCVCVCFFCFFVLHSRCRSVVESNAAAKQEEVNDCI